MQSLWELEYSRKTESFWRLLSGDLTCSKRVLPMNAAAHTAPSPHRNCSWDGDGTGSQLHGPAYKRFWEEKIPEW